MRFVCQFCLHVHLYVVVIYKVLIVADICFGGKTHPLHGELLPRNFSVTITFYSYPTCSQYIYVTAVKRPVLIKIIHLNYCVCIIVMQYMYNLLHVCCSLQELGIPWQPTIILHIQSQGKDVICEQRSVLTFFIMAGQQRLC